MQFIDLAAQQRRIRDEIESRIKNVLDHGHYILGPEIGELEEVLSHYVGVRHGIACSSGTDALLLALMAYGVGPGDAVFTTPFTFIATAEVIALLGAVPVFVDIDPVTFNINTAQLEQAVEALMNMQRSVYPLPVLPDKSNRLRARGIIGVDLFGLPADYERIHTIAEKHDLFVIEDAAQSFGSEYHGRKSCSLASVGCTSFFPAKPLGCYGDGGMCFTGDDEFAERIRSLSIHGKGHDKYDNIRIGINGRIDTLQAAILLAKFKIFPEEVRLRQSVAQRYTEFIRNASSSLIPPQAPENCLSVWAQYSVLAGDEQHRSALQNKLKEAGIPTAVYYPKPLHLQTAFAFLGYREGDFPVSEDYARRIFSLPMHPYLREEDQERIVGVLSC